MGALCPVTLTYCAAPWAAGIRGSDGWISARALHHSAGITVTTASLAQPNTLLCHSLFHFLSISGFLSPRLGVTNPPRLHSAAQFCILICHRGVDSFSGTAIQLRFTRTRTLDVRVSRLSVIHTDMVMVPDLWKESPVSLLCNKALEVF